MNFVDQTSVLLPPRKREATLDSTRHNFEARQAKRRGEGKTPLSQSSSAIKVPPLFDKMKGS
ncbi:hypothetical protein SESBI_28291 [Sesbania bispinosa]|nr:hypothetical protein SESBI_28291 [Sesbania bispinosa]